MRNVIGKAIADCLTEDNEFAGKKAGDVITFDVDAKTYTAENCNVVVPWSLIHVYTCEYKTKGECDSERLLNEVGMRIKNECKAINNIDDTVKDVVRDIKEYTTNTDRVECANMCGGKPSVKQ